MAHELTALVDWFGTLSGLFGVSIAIYLQVINPRRVNPGHVLGLFVAGAALVMVFSTAWIPPNGWTALSLKLMAIFLFVTLEGVSGFLIWQRAEAAPPNEVVSSLFENNGEDA
jgi:hypothetical protein